MTNHPNRVATPFHVRAYPGDLLGKFHSGIDAQLVAALWSKHMKSWAEVNYFPRSKKDGGGLIGQFTNGEPTPEFVHLREMLVINRILTPDRSPCASAPSGAHERRPIPNEVEDERA